MNPQTPVRQLRNFSLLALISGLAACGNSLPPTASIAGRDNVNGPGWSAVHADGRNSDYSAAPGARDLSLAWNRRFPGTINLGPTSNASGRIFVTVNAQIGCALYALDSTTGNVAWCSEKVDRFSSISSPLIDRDGHLYLADSRAMHAFDSDGTLLWETPIVGVPLSAQFTPEGNIIFITHIGRIYVLSRDSGAAVLAPVELIPGATYRPGENVLSCATGRPQCPSANTPSMDLASGRFTFTFWAPGTENSGIRAMLLEEGAEPALSPLWTNDSLPGGSASSPTLSADGSRVYVTDNLGGLHALDAASGATIWSFDIGYAAAGSPSCSPEGLIMPAGGGIASGGGRVVAVSDLGDRAAIAWRRNDWINGGISTQAAGGLAYITDLDFGVVPYLVVVDTATGDELDREFLPGIQGFTVGTTVGPDGMVYVPSILGQLSAFRPVTSTTAH